MSEVTTRWTSVEDIERYLQIDLDSNTKPSNAQVLDFIEEVENDMLKEGWGSQTAVSGTIILVEPTHAVSRGSVAWWIQGLPETEQGRLVVPPYRPIITVTSGAFFKNDNSLSEAPNWELLDCKDNVPAATDTDFTIIKKENHKTGNYDGIALYFYNEVPNAGSHTLSGGWTYGYNLDTKILREYATLKTCEKVILARLFSGQPMNIASYTGGDMNSWINTQYEVQLAWIKARCDEIRKRHLPEELPVATLQGI
jgi:hypothetical protein